MAILKCQGISQGSKCEFSNFWFRDVQIKLFKSFLSLLHQHGWVGVIILLRVRCRKKYIFLVFSEQKFWKVKRTFLTPSRQPLNRFSLNLATSLADSFPWNRVGDFCFLSPFSNNRYFFKGSADDLSPALWLYPVVTKEQMHVSKIWDTVF